MAINATFNVLNYRNTDGSSVDNTGTTVSTTGIQAAINAAASAVSSAGSASVYFPAGTYKVDNTLTVPFNRLAISGDGPEASIIQFTNTSYTTHCLSVSGSFFSIRDMTLATSSFNGVTSTQMAPYTADDPSALAGAALYFAGPGNCHVDNMVFL